MILPLFAGCERGILSPAGVITAAERHIFFYAVLLMSLVVVPVIFLTLIIVRKYRASNLSATYSPEWTHSTLLETIWWGIPCIIIAILASITWITAHTLDPYRPIVYKKEKPLLIQVVALDWRWLFIYPEEKIATVNTLFIPLRRPVEFRVTSDAPMNSFAIPQLAGQIYAMAGMQTKLNVLATRIGIYDGMSTNFSGDGFAGMRFKAHVLDPKDFSQWVKMVQKTYLEKHLNWSDYRQLAIPSKEQQPLYFGSADPTLYHEIIMSYMKPGKENAEKYAYQTHVLHQDVSS